MPGAAARQPDVVGARMAVAELSGREDDLLERIQKIPASAVLDAAAVKLSLERVRKVGFDLPAAPYATEFASFEAIEAAGAEGARDRTPHLRGDARRAPRAGRDHDTLRGPAVRPA